MTRTQAGLAMITLAPPILAWVYQFAGYFNGRWDRLAHKTPR